MAKQNTEVEELRLALSQAQEQIAALVARKEHAPSRFFQHDKTGERIAWSNLSETKRYFETYAPGVLTELVTANGSLLNSEAFHRALLRRLGL